MSEAKITSQEIDIAREFYRPAAARASLLYFILNDLNSINPIYQFSLKAFSVVFQKAIQKADASDQVEIRVNSLIDCITFSVYQYTSRGLLIWFVIAIVVVPMALFQHHTRITLGILEYTNMHILIFFHSLFLLTRSF